MFKNKSIMFLYGLTNKLFVNFIGRLMGAEILALLTLPFLDLKVLIKQNNVLKVVLKCFALLLFFQIISDIVNNSQPVDYIRGWAVLGFAMLSVLFLVAYLSKGSKLILYYLMGLAITNIIFKQETIDLNIQEMEDNYFKAQIMGFANPLSLLVSGLLFKYKKQKTGLAFLVFYALLNFVLGARSNGLIFLIASILIGLRVYNIKLSKPKIIGLTLFFGTVLYLGYIYYVNKVLNEGFGGKNAIEQLGMTTNPYNPFELLYYGRTEAVVAGYAIAEKPWLGYGSWAKDPNHKYAKIMQILQDNDRLNTNKDYIPGHSVILTVWLWSGLFGFLVACYMFGSLFWQFSKLYKYSPVNFVMVILMVLMVNMFWNLLFSPFGHLRTSMPVVIALLIVYKKEMEIWLVYQQNIKTKKT